MFLRGGGSGGTELNLTLLCNQFGQFGQLGLYRVVEGGTVLVGPIADSYLCYSTNSVGQPIQAIGLRVQPTQVNQSSQISQFSRFSQFGQLVHFVRFSQASHAKVNFTELVEQPVQSIHSVHSVRLD